MPKNYYLAVAGLGLLITTAVVGISTFAQTTTDQTTKPNFIAQHQEFKQAITDGDYDAWSKIMQEQVENLRTNATELESQINQQTFDKLTQAHELMQEGKVDEARAIFEEIGMPGPMGHHGMMGKMDHHFFQMKIPAPEAEN